VLDTSAHIADPTLATPLPIEVLIRAAKADDAMARALVAKRNPVIEAVRAESKLEGLAEGKLEGFAEGKQAGLAEGKQAGLAEGKQAGLAEGKQAGLAEGKQAGLAEGKQAGLAEGRAESLIVMLQARDIALGSADRARILGERDPETLARWTARVATCKDVVEMFGGT
jgi:flagellar biosynthesis/type III secretory pathway protein FliH